MLPNHRSSESTATEPSSSAARRRQYRWLSFPITLAISTFIACLTTLMAPGLPFRDQLLISISIGVSGWTVSNILLWLTRYRFLPLILLVAVPVAVFGGYKISSLFGVQLFGTQTLAEQWLHSGTSFWESVGVPLLLATSGAAFMLLLGKMASYRIELESQRRRTAEAQLTQAVSELALLQAQIEPHFLFNTLAHVLSTVEREPIVAREMLEQLTRYLRGTLDRSRKRTHRLGEEQQLIEALLAIAAMRLGKRLGYRISIDASLQDLQLPPLLLQPLVENAIRHGIEPSIDGGDIHVEASATGGELILRVTDTGVGLAAAAPEGGDKYTDAVTATERHLVRAPLKELLEQLNPGQFAQIHRSILVNLREIGRIEHDMLGRTQVHLKKSPDVLPVSRSYTARFRQM